MISGRMSASALFCAAGKGVYRPAPRRLVQDMGMEQTTPGAALLADRVAVVTGAGGGIGAATARLFAEQGARVVVADIDPELAQRVADEITSSGGSAMAVDADVREGDQVGGCARSLRDWYGRADAQ